MKSRMLRFVSVAVAVIGGVGLVLFFTLIGNKSEGPLGDFFEKMSFFMGSIEENLIINKREGKRSQKLNWLNPCKKFSSKCSDPDTIWFGAYDNHSEISFQNILKLEDSLNLTFPLIHLYTAWGSGSKHRFPVKRATAIYSMGSIPVITWEPWLTAFEPNSIMQLKPMDMRDKNGLADIADGIYDAYLDEWAADIKNFNKTIFIRFAHEMNDPYRYPWGPQNNKPEEFVKAWQYVVDYFNRAGVNNVVWIWSPHPAYGWFNYYYPGEAYVDWIGVGVLNYGNVVSWSDWWSFDEIFGNHYASLSEFQKPVMITEFGSLATGGNQAEWFYDALSDLPEKYPAVKSVMFFHTSNDNTINYKSLDWYIIDDPLVIDAISNAIMEWD